ncbi:MAG: aminotransferase class V-fold PLP-dependent enzyme [Tissierellia bacterium]|nr:aminotransferase class V-fold PLP-dependent enzyme [Tissierellia bacterium]
MIYLDNGATSLWKPKEVEEEILDALSGNYGNPGRGMNGPSLKTLRKILTLRTEIQKTFGGESSQKIILNPGITWSLNLVLPSLIQPGDHVLTTVLEHNSVLRPLYALEEKGVEISFLPMKPGPFLDENILQKNTKYLVVTAASNVTGDPIDLLAFHDFAKEHNLIFIVDGAQALGTIPQELENMDQVIYCFTGHKGLHGPTGTGGMIIKGEYDFSPVFSGGTGYQSFQKSQPLELPGLFEPGTLPFHSLFGLYGALKAWKKEENIFYHLQELRRIFIQELEKIPGVTIYGQKKFGAPVISCNIKDYPSSVIGDYLWHTYEIAIRSGSHCAPMTHKYLNTMDKGTLRFSFSVHNTKEELFQVLEILEDISKRGIR